jgi:hypothetical protein
VNFLGVVCNYELMHGHELKIKVLLYNTVRGLSLGVLSYSTILQKIINKMQISINEELINI